MNTTQYKIGQYCGWYGKDSSTSQQSEQNFSYIEVAGTYQGQEDDTLKFDYVQVENSTEKFVDPHITFTATEANFSQDLPYRILFTFNRGTTAQRVTFKLVNRDEEGSTVDIEEVETFVIPAGENQTFNYEIIFIPDMAYKEIVLELQRESYDFQVEGGRKINIKNIVLNTINNIFNDIARNLIIRKIGIQGPTGLTFIIDGEVVRIGRSGIYELYHDSLAISFIGVILNEGDSFIMDYKY